MKSEAGPNERVCEVVMKYLSCECTRFEPMEDDAPIVEAYHRAREEGARAGFVPLLVKADSVLWECLKVNTCPEHRVRGGLSFDAEAVAEYRRHALSAPLQDGRLFLEELADCRRQWAADACQDWEKDVLGEMKGGEADNSFIGCWDLFSGRTFPLILAKIPVKHPWEVFAWLPFGGWNSCPDTPRLMAAARYWFEQYGAVPAVVSRDTLEFELAAPAPEERAMELAVEQYGLCPDLNQGEGGAIGKLADGLRQSTVWHFWWD